jgi:endonuclease G, mitochondrial
MPRDSSDSFSRLESLRSSGAFDSAAKALANGHPILRELGIDPDRTMAALNADPTALESAGTGIGATQLEAIIRITTRPPMLVRGGKVEMVPLPDFPGGTDTRIVAAEPFIAGVGRIEFLNRGIVWGGTGWILQDEEDDEHYHVLTNRHVAEIVARRNHRGEGVFMRSPLTMVQYGAQLDFNEEVDAPPEAARPAEILDFTYLADSASADVAIGRIRRPEGFEVAPLEIAEADGQDEEMVGVIGYPAHDSRNDENEMANYFKGLFDVKRFAPGFLMRAGGTSVLSHDCTTLGGNSGSPVLSLVSQKVVGLHFSGVYGEQNSAVRASTLLALIRGDRPTQILARSLPAPVEAEAADGSHAAEDLAGRDGFDPAFLDGQSVPLPALPQGVFDLAKPSDATAERPHELRYTHFGVLYDLARRSPMVAAVNIDGERHVPVKRGRDRWYFDLRIPREAQLGQADFPGDLDRGHMVRRQDPNWGDRPVAERANGDTFHYTNASPQHADLNQSGVLWLGLEDYILNSAVTHGFRASVFTGPILREDDPFFDEIGLQLPVEYWKVVAMLAEDERGSVGLHATAYVLSQGRFIADFLADREQPEAVEGFAFGQYRTYQVRVADFEERTGYDFGSLRNGDPLERLAHRLGTPEGTPVLREIVRPGDMVL